LAFYKKCHVFVLASYHDGLPRTILEAVVLVRAIITTDVPGCREIVEEGFNGLLVPKANTDMLADKIIWFIEHANQLDTMAKNSLKLARREFDVHIVNNKLSEILQLTGHRHD
jgi:glycosyltransferase involved in cell wall biosynthesis